MSGLFNPLVNCWSVQILSGMFSGIEPFGIRVERVIPQMPEASYCALEPI